MAATAATDTDRFTVEEARLAHAAAAGDGGARAVLHERYAQRAFNLALRITGSEAEAADAVQEAFLAAMRGVPGLADGELAFGPYLLAATHNACHDQVRRRRRERASGTIRKPLAPLGPESRQEEIGEASMRLPERQREVLALRELEDLSYGEIAAIMEVSPNAVAQLISRARINLRDELGGTSLASVAAPSPECERALPLIAMRDDGQLEAASPDAAWLDSHLAGCERCRLAVEEMREAGASYRAWAPIAAAPWLLEETMAKAAAPGRADWSVEISGTAAVQMPAGSPPAAPPAYPPGPSRGKPPRRRTRLAAGLALLLFLAGLTAVLVEGNPSATPAELSAGTTPKSSFGASRRDAEAGKVKASGARRKARTRTATKGTVGETISAPGPALVQAPAGGAAPSKPHPVGHSGKTGIRQAGQPPAPKPKPVAGPTPAAPPASTPAPTVEESPPAEESTKGPHRKHEPPGKSPNHPPR